MQPDYLIALTHLDEKTPQFFRDEVFAHGSTKMMAVARSVLRLGINPRRESFRALRKLIDVRECGNAG